MRVLIIGAGAVGQVYGWHLQRGGAEVTYLVKEKYRAAAEAGYTLFPLNGWGAPKRERFEGFSVVSTPDEVAARPFDQVWITISSTALRGDWRVPTLDAIGDATVVSFCPGHEDADLLRADVPDDRLVWGMIPFIAYQAPLPGETRFAEEGLAFWHPPLARTPLSGARPGATAAVRALRRGGCGATRAKDVPTAAMFPTALMMPHLVALELCDWSFAAVRGAEVLGLAAKASREACAVLAEDKQVAVPLLTKLARPALIGFLSRLAPVVMPLDIETYLQYHFTKVGDQTRLFIDGYLALAAAQGRDVPGLQGLRDRLCTRDARPREASASGTEAAAA